MTTTTTTTVAAATVTSNVSYDCDTLNKFLSSALGSGASLPVCCDEKYIRCNSGQFVTSISLPDHKLQGSLDAFTQFSQLTRLDLRSNFIVGTIPASITALPLTYLDVSNNSLSGEIPQTIGNLAKLTWLALDGNLLNGAIPSSMGQLFNVGVLGLSNNQLSGSIPDSFSNLSSVQIMKLSNNKLTGNISESLANLTKLDSFEVSGNCFGSGPDKFPFTNSCNSIATTSTISATIFSTFNDTNTTSYTNWTHYTTVRYANGGPDMTTLSTFQIGIIVGGSVGLVAIIISVVMLVLWRRKRSSHTKKAPRDSPWKRNKKNDSQVFAPLADVTTATSPHRLSNISVYPTAVTYLNLNTKRNAALREAARESSSLIFNAAPVRFDEEAFETEHPIAPIIPAYQTPFRSESSRIYTQGFTLTTVAGVGTSGSGSSTSGKKLGPAKLKKTHRKSNEMRQVVAEVIVSESAQVSPPLHTDNDSDDEESVPPSFMDWTSQEVADWLTTRGFSRVIANRFIDMQATGASLVSMDLATLAIDLADWPPQLHQQIYNSICSLKGVSPLTSPPPPAYQASH